MPWSCQRCSGSEVVVVEGWGAPGHRILQSRGRPRGVPAIMQHADAPRAARLIFRSIRLSRSSLGVGCGRSPEAWPPLDFGDGYGYG